MIVDVIPAIRLPRHISSVYSYAVPKKLTSIITVGSIVSVSFRNKSIYGIVKSINTNQKTASKGLLTIQKVLFPQPLVTLEQLQLINWLATHYFTSLSTAAKLLIPEIPKKNSNDEFRIMNLKTENKKRSRTKVIVYTTVKERDKYISKIFRNQKSEIRNSQALYLVPTHHRAEELKIQLYNKKMSERVFWKASSGKKTRFQDYLAVLSNHVSIVVGTRSSLFAPFQNLSHIIIENEHHHAYKSDQTPRYHAREIAQQLAKRHKAKMTYLTPSLSLELYSQFKDNLEKRDQALKKSNTVMLIDLKDERLKKNYTSISDTLRNSIENSFKTKKQVFLLLNRRGHSTSTLCNDCGYVLLCPDCELPLALHANSILICHHCRRKQELPPLCPKCSGPNIKHSGKGTQKLEEEIKKLFPKISIIRIDKDSYYEPLSGINAFSKSVNAPEFQDPRAHPPKSRRVGTKEDKTFDFRVLQAFGLIIGTEFALPYLDWTNIGTIGVVNADSSLYRPDFRASERTYQLLNELIINTEKQSDIIIQTYNPESIIFEAIKNKNLQLFYKHELKLRTLLKYPPQYTIIKLIYRHTNEKKAIGEAMHIYHRLKKHLMLNIKSQVSGVELVKPFAAWPKKTAGKYQFNLIVRLPNNTSQKIYKKINDLVPAGWVFDRDPETLL